ncbi:uncharacterized protein [Acropora muricata]|uniref:uncharacterized protein LOC114977267 isoform X1 n=1 Tax=Acropora millepora TaxID=45264 RepID=UPI0010FC7816|nr:uncharacterized protein LOC114977267 isoform X1 [Acropora millepora]
MSILNDLFEQIIQSEEKIRTRFLNLRKVSDEIQNYQVKCEDLLDEMKSLQGLLVLKNQRLSEEELNLKWCKIREEVLVQKRAELLTGRENLIKEKKETEETISYHKNRFANGALEFMANFDFCWRMREKRIVKFCSHQEKK